MHIINVYKNTVPAYIGHPIIKKLALTDIWKKFTGVRICLIKYISPLKDSNEIQFFE